MPPTARFPFFFFFNEDYLQQKLFSQSPTRLPVDIVESVAQEVQEVLFPPPLKKKKQKKSHSSQTHTIFKIIFLISPSSFVQ